MAAVGPAPAWWQRGAATLQPPAAPGSSPKGVGLFVAWTLIKVSAEIVVTVNGQLPLRNEELGDEQWILVTRVPNSVLSRVMDAKGPVMLHRNRVVALSARVQKGIGASLALIRPFTLILAFLLILFPAVPRGGPTALLRRRCAVPSPAISVAELGMQKVAQLPAAAGLAEMEHGGADVMMMNVIMLLGDLMKTMIAMLSG